MIICAAIKLTMNNAAGTELIIPGHRHGDCYQIINQLNSNWKFATKVEGFITHENIFLDREEAYSHALLGGQISQSNYWYKLDHDEKELYSEDLY